MQDSEKQQILDRIKTVKTGEQPKSRKNLVLVVILIIGLIVVAAEAFLIFQKLQHQDTPQDTKVATETTPKPKTVAPVVSNDINTTPSAIPSNWAKFTSKKYGVTFSTPSNWTVVEIDPVTSGIKDTKTVSYKIDISFPNDTTGGSEIAISEGSLDDIIKRDTTGLKITSTSLKWNGHDAMNVSMQGDSTKLLYVQIGIYVYAVPEYGQAPTALTDKKISDSEWKTFTNSIQIKAS